MKLRQSLTPRQGEALNCFKEYCEKHINQTPTYAEIAAMMETSKPSAFVLIGELVKKGYLVRTKDSGSRALSLPVEDLK